MGFRQQWTGRGRGLKVTFIMPAIGARGGTPERIRTWQMEPLSIAVLAALTPSHVEREFFDDRLEEIDYDTKTDLVAVTCETYTARRTYEIAARFRKRGVPVVAGGFHPTLMPDEASRYVDAVVVGDGEPVWQRLLDDLEAGDLKKIYRSETRTPLDGIFPDRSIYGGKRYLNLGLVETGRGCRYRCDFCTVCEFYGSTWRPRPIEDVVREIREMGRRSLHFFVDDNVVMDHDRARELCRALTPLKIRWISQGSLDMARDPELLRLMKESGCLGVLIGFESMDAGVLRSMNKGVNLASDATEAVRKIHDAGLHIYATYVFGYDQDTPESFERTFAHAQKQAFFITAFNHVVPFPGTQLYDRLRREGRLLDNQWWLNHDYTFGSAAFHPALLSADELTNLSYTYRGRFYNLRHILGRLFGFRRNLKNTFTFLLVSLLARRDVPRRQGLPMGRGWDYEPGADPIKGESDAMEKTT